MYPVGRNKIGRGQIPDRGSCPLSTQLMEDRLRHASGPVQPPVLLHTWTNVNIAPRKEEDGINLSIFQSFCYFLTG